MKDLADYNSLGEFSGLPTSMEEFVDKIFSQGKSFGVSEAFLVSLIMENDIVTKDKVWEAIYHGKDPKVMESRINGIAELLGTTPEYLLSTTDDKTRFMTEKGEDGVLRIPYSIWNNASRAAKVATKYCDYQTISDALEILREAVKILEKAERDC